MSYRSAGPLQALDCMRGASRYQRGMSDVRPWWEHRAIVALLILLSGAPLWGPALPPLTDLPGHLGRYAVQLDAGRSSLLALYYAFDWHWIGNLGVDILVQLLGPLLGVEVATKAIVVAIPMLTAAGFLATAREVHGRIPPTAIFALPLAYNYAFNWGFVNFSLSMALAFLAFALWLRMARAGSLRLRAVVFAILSLGLWTVHIFGWALLCVLAFSAELIRQWDAGRRWFALLLTAGWNCVPLALPLLPMALTFGDGGAGGQPFGHTWFNWPLKERWVMSILRDRWEWLDVGSVALLGLIVMGGLAAWGVRRRRPEGRSLILAATIMTALFVLMPFALLGSAYADMRLAPFALATALLAIGAPQHGARWIALAAFLFFGVRMVGTTVSLRDYDTRFSQELAAVDHIPKGARVLALIGKPCRVDWAVHRLDHLPSMAIVRRQAFTNDQWQAAGAQLLTVRYQEAAPFLADPSQFVTVTACARRERLAYPLAIATFPRAAFDYVWVIQQPDEAADDRGLQPVWRSGRSALYRVTTE